MDDGMFNLDMTPEEYNYTTEGDECLHFDQSRSSSESACEQDGDYPSVPDYPNPAHEYYNTGEAVYPSPSYSGVPSPSYGVDDASLQSPEGQPNAPVKRKRENRYKNASPNVLQRRRAQNRASQRAYRERKDQRIKDLESLLTDAKHEVDILKRTIDRLEQVLQQRCGMYPPQHQPEFYETARLQQPRFPSVDLGNFPHPTALDMSAVGNGMGMEPQTMNPMDFLNLPNGGNGFSL